MLEMIKSLKLFSVVLLISMFIWLPSSELIHAMEINQSELHVHKSQNDLPEKILLPSTAVIIDAGHGGIDGGASFGNVLEKDINLIVAKKLYAILQSKGIPTVLNRTGDYALSDENSWHKISSRHLRDLSQRMGLTREIDHIVFVSLHVNAGRNTAAHGPLVLHQHTGESALLALNVQDQLNQLYQTEKKIVPVKSFYLLKYIKSPSILVELGFISNPEDRDRLTNATEQNKIAAAISDGILQYFWIN